MSHTPRTDGRIASHSDSPSLRELCSHYNDLLDHARQLERELAEALSARERAAPVDMLLFCPHCGEQHIDAPDGRTSDWTNPPHRSHLCHHCGHIWRPADVPTNGVATIKTKGEKDGNPRPRYYATAADFEAAESRLAEAKREGYVRVPREPSEAMLRAGMDDLGWWVEPVEAEYEGGVPVSCELSQADADQINAQQKDAMADAYKAMIDAAMLSAAPREEHSADSASTLDDTKGETDE